MGTYLCFLLLCQRYDNFAVSVNLGLGLTRHAILYYVIVERSGNITHIAFLISP